MKKHVLIIGVLALLSFSCSTEDVAKSQESNLSQLITAKKSFERSDELEK